MTMKKKRLSSAVSKLPRATGDSGKVPSARIEEANMRRQCRARVEQVLLHGVGMVLHVANAPRVDCRGLRISLKDMQGLFDDA
jgi:hypothetical protein